MVDILIVGGGPSGVFTAIWAKTRAPHLSVAILEKTPQLLGKVRLSGGGRCNLTNAFLHSKNVTDYYPRGSNELISPLTKWSPLDTMNWFTSKGVILKTEQEGKIFPASDQSKTIIDCLTSELDRLGIEIRLSHEVEEISKQNNHFFLHLKNKNSLECQKLILATGGNQAGHKWAQYFGHSIVSPVPSLFAFNIEASILNNLSGIVIDPVELKLDQIPHPQRGALMITHFGFSGPAVLKLSAFQARYLNDQHYQANLLINWLPNRSEQQIYDIFSQLKLDFPHQQLGSFNPFSFPKSFWKVILNNQFNLPLRDFGLKQLRKIAQRLNCDRYQIQGKSTHKQEFVTCGGVKRCEIDFKTMKSKICPNLFFAGEIIDIDGVTGGLNLQNCWTTGYIAGTNNVDN